MKKLFFMAILAGLLLLPSCSKNDTVKVEVPDLTDTYELARPMLGLDINVVDSILDSSGWEFEGSDPQEIANCKSLAFSKINDENGIILWIIANESDSKIINVVYFARGYVCNGDRLQELFFDITETPVINGETINFTEMFYGPGSSTTTDFNTALQAVPSGWNSFEGLKALWGTNTNGIVINSETDSGITYITVSIGNNVYLAY